MCIAESFCCAAEINTTLQTKYTSIKLEKEKKNSVSIAVEQTTPRL